MARAAEHQVNHEGQILEIAIEDNLGEVSVYLSSMS
jgi:hypothetical protein